MSKRHRDTAQKRIYRCQKSTWKYATLLAIRKCKLTQWDYHCSSIRMTIMKGRGRNTASNAGKDLEQLDLSTLLMEL